MKVTTTFAFLCCVFVLGAYLDREAPMDAQREARSLHDAQQAAKAAYQQEAMAAKACRKASGESTTIQWTVNGEPVCIFTSKGN